MQNYDASVLKHLNEIHLRLDSYLSLMYQDLEESEYINSDNIPPADILPGDEIEDCTVPAPIGKKNSSVKPLSVSQILIPDYLKPAARGNLNRVLENKEESFSEMLLRLIDEKDLKDSEVYKNANIDRRLFSKIRGDKNYLPSKKTAISFCLALHLSLEETNALLGTAGYALSMSTRFDLIIRFLIEQKEYDIHFVNIILDDYGEGSLSR